MKKYVLTLIFWLSLAATGVYAQTDYLINIIEQSDTHIVLQFNLLNYELATDSSSGLTTVKLENSFYPTKTGVPCLPQLSASVLLPNDKLPQILIDHIEADTIAGISVAATTPQQKRSTPVAQTASNMAGEAAEVQMSNPYIFRGENGISLTINPFAVIEGRLVVRRSFFVRLYFDASTKTDYTLPPVEYAQLLNRHFINYKPSANKSYPMFADPGAVLIVCSEQYVEAAQRLAQWKRQLGRTTYVQTVAEGVTATDIKTIINQYYTSQNIVFAILIGDSNTLPTIIQDLPDAPAAACDPAYGYLDGNDAYPEVIVGRFSVETVQQADMVVDKSIDYERGQIRNPDYLKKYLLIASSEGPGADNEMDYEHLRNIKKDLLDYTYISGNEMYDGTQGEDDMAGNPSASMVVDAVNAGRGMLNYIGHGSPTRLTTSSFSTADVPLLTNTQMWPFMITVACQSGNFYNKTCLAEELLRSSYNGEASGMVAVLASSIDQDWNPPMVAHDEMIDLLTHQKANDISTFGGMVANGCMKMNESYPEIGKNNAATWTIFGDPSLQLRTTVPQAIVAEVPAEIGFGANTLEVHSEIEAALVTVLQGDDIVGSQYIESGVAIVPINVPQADNLTVTISKPNYVPLQATVQQRRPTEAFILLQQTSLFDTNGNKSSLAAGKSVFCHIDLKNIGLSDAQSVDVKITTDNPLVKITQPTQPRLNIAAGGLISVDALWAMEVSAMAAHNEAVVFRAQATDNVSGLQWTHSFVLRVVAANVQLLEPQLAEIQGNMNNRMETGESFTLSVLAKNTGGLTAEMQSLQLQFDSRYVKSDGRIFTFSLAPGQEQRFGFECQMAAVMPLKTPFVYSFCLSGENGSRQISRYRNLREQYDDFDSHILQTSRWKTGTSNGWSAVSETENPTNYIAQSANIGNNGKTYIETQLSVIRDDSVGFLCKTSTELDYDFLHFYIDDIEQHRWSGENDWTYASFAVAKGLHTLRWEYATDASTTAGQNRAWIDSITFPPFVESTILLPSFSVDSQIFAFENLLYTANITINTVDGTTPDFAMLSVPDFLQWQRNGNNITISGIPADTDAGNYRIVFAAAHANTDAVLDSFDVQAIRLLPDVKIAEVNLLQQNVLASQTASLNIGLKNNALTTSDNISVKLLSQNQYVEIQSAEILYNSLPFNELKWNTAPFSFTVNTDCPPNTIVPFDLRLSNSETGYEQELHFELTVNKSQVNIVDFKVIEGSNGAYFACGDVLHFEATIENTATEIPVLELWIENTDGTVELKNTGIMTINLPEASTQTIAFEATAINCTQKQISTTQLRLRYANHLQYADSKTILNQRYENFEHEAVSWLQLSDGWQVVSDNEVNHALQANNTNNFLTVKTLPLTVLRPDSLTFWLALHTRGNDATLRLYTDGELQKTWFSDTETTVSIPVSAGYHVFEWRFYQATGLSANIELQIDDIVLPACNLSPAILTQQLPVAFVGEPYEHRFTITDTDADPLWLKNITLPAWLSYSFDGSVLILKGIPITESANETIMLQFSDGINKAEEQDFSFAVQKSRFPIPDGQNSKVVVYTDDNSQQVELVVYANTETIFSAQLFDNSGRLLHTLAQNIRIAPGETHFAIPVLPSTGIYIIETKTGDTQRVLRFVGRK